MQHTHHYEQSSGGQDLTPNILPRQNKKFLILDSQDNKLLSHAIEPDSSNTNIYSEFLWKQQNM